MTSQPTLWHVYQRKKTGDSFVEFTGALNLKRYSCLRFGVTNIITTFFKSPSNTIRFHVELSGRVCGEDTHLHMAVQSSVVQGCAPPSVGDIDAAQQGNDHFCTLDSLIGCCHVEGRLPVLVPCIDISRVLNQYLHCFLQQKQSSQGSLANNQYLLDGRCFTRPRNYGKGRLPALTGWLQVDILL